MSNNKKISNRLGAAWVACLLMSSLPVTVQAADGAPAASAGSQYNPVMITLISVIVMMLFAIWAVTGVLRSLTLVYRDQLRAQRRNTKGAAVLLALVFLLSSVAGIAGEMPDAAAAPALPAAIAGIPIWDFYLLITVLLIELAALVALLVQINTLANMIRTRPEIHPAAKPVARESFWDRFHAAVSVEKEKDIMLDHDYDGIHELDNSLPPWWKYGFYITILVGVVYIYYYHFSGSGPSSYDEYVTEVEKGEADKVAFLAKSASNIDESNVTFLNNPSDIGAGQQVYQNNCVACHAKDGGGGVGPNLTDKYWLHGGGIADVFKSIKYGWQEKGMKSWKDDFSPKQIAQLTAYIRSLNGSTPAAPKEKQGELYVEAGDAGQAAPVTDSTKVTDSSAKPKKMALK